MNTCSATKVSVRDRGVDARLLAIARHRLAVVDAGAYWPRTTDRSTSSPVERPQRLDDLELLVADDVGVERVRRLHRDEREELQQVVLHHVAQRAGLLVVAGARADAFRFGHGDLHVVDVPLS